jgi:2-dehydropantoate 2-reductase
MRLARRASAPSLHRGGRLRVLVFGAGVIGSVYGGRLLQAGHRVTVLARGRRLADLTASGLLLRDVQSGHHDVLPVTAVSAPPPGARYDLVLVAVRWEQLTAAVPELAAMHDGSDVLIFGNAAGRVGELVEALGDRAVFGFPAAGGVRDGPLVRYVLIRQQQTMLGEASGAVSPRLRRLRATLEQAGFSTTISRNIEGWLLAHAAFVVPIAFALYRAGGDPARLAADRRALAVMVRATRQAFDALGAQGTVEIPRNLRTLYRLPTAATAAYWRRVLSGPRGELWFAAHSRAATEEMRSLARQLLGAVERAEHPTPDLTALLAAHSPDPAR